MKQGHEARACSMDMKQGHEARTWSKGMQHGHEALTSSIAQRGHADFHFKDMELWHAALICTSGIQHRQEELPCSTGMHQGPASWACSMDMKHGHEAWTHRIKCSMDMKQGHAAWTCSFLTSNNYYWTVGRRFRKTKECSANDNGIRHYCVLHNSTLPH
jgi:hypothetical protein